MVINDQREEIGSYEELKDIHPRRLQFYEKLREKITGFARTKTGEKGGKFAEYVLALPDFFILLCRLAVDKRVKTSQKVLLGGIIAYVVSPIDIIPDFIPFIGYADDLVLVVFGLNIIMNDLDNQILLDNWSGQQDVMDFMRKITISAENILNRNVLRKIKIFLEKLDNRR